jgi:1,4-dihydroxy-2-naphthoyl-CoA hydrolase
VTPGGERRLVRPPIKPSTVGPGRNKLLSMSADLDALVALMPFAGQLGVVLDEASADRVVARLAWAPHLCTSGGLMHGGVLMSLADTAGALVTFLGLPKGATTATITSTSQLFRPVSGGTVRAVAIPLHRGRTTVTAQSSLYDSEQRSVALTTQIQAVRPR